MILLAPQGSPLSRLDAGVAAAFFVGMVALAWRGGLERRPGRRAADATDFFLAGRRLSWPRACASMLAAEVSALALLGLAASSYAGDCSALKLFASAAAARLALAWLYVPIVYPGSETTIYGYLDGRFGPATRRAASGLFLGMKLLGAGARLAAGAAVAAAMLGLRPSLVVLVLAAACGAYTARGGLRAVSAAAAAQAAALFLAPAALLWIALRSWGGGPGAAWLAARDAGRLSLGPPGTALELAPAFFVALATFGADQELAQNALAAPSVSDGRKTMVWAAALSALLAALYLALGAAIFAYYRLNPGLARPADGALVFAHFALTAAPPGLRGLAAAALLAAAAHLPLCSLSAAFVEDFYRPWLRPRKSEAHYLKTARAFVWFFAATLAALALVWSESEPWLAFLLKLGGTLLGPLLGLFLFALFSRRTGDRANVVAVAAATGAAAVALALIEAGKLSWGPNWLVVGGALATAVLARQLAPWLDAQ